MKHLNYLYFETNGLEQVGEFLNKLGSVTGENSVEYKELFDLSN